MSSVNIKIVGVEGDSVLVKFASENSAKSIDEYDAVAFQPKAMGYSTVDAFIAGIKNNLLMQVITRDNLEQAPKELDASSWVGHEHIHEETLPHELNVNDAFKNPEVKI